MDKSQISSIVIVRTDRIGDVILTLPMISVLKENFPSASISMMLRTYTSNLAEGQPGLSSILHYDENGTPKPLFRMLQELRGMDFSIAVLVYPRFRIALLLWLAGIRVRVGTGYRWYSFLFTKRVFEHRKTVTKHEVEYNLSLLTTLGCELPQRVESKLAISDQEKRKAQNIRSQLGISESERIAMLHPGSGGSAREWRPEFFSELAIHLSQKGFRVVISGNRKEQSLVEKVVGLSKAHACAFLSDLTLKEFGAFIQTAEVFVANSTGPLHIAAAVGTPLVGFYPPIRVMSPKRWGPLTEKKVIFVPDPEKCKLCNGRVCRGRDCMDQISVTQVAGAIDNLLHH